MAHWNQAATVHHVEAHTYLSAVKTIILQLKRMSVQLSDSQKINSFHSELNPHERESPQSDRVNRFFNTFLIQLGAKFNTKIEIFTHYFSLTHTHTEILHCT